MDDLSLSLDRIEKPAETACAEVERGLRELDEKTLLFLNNIREITYALPDGDIGFVKRTDVDDVTIRVEVSQGEDFVESSWLRLVGPASTAHEGPSPLAVAAAFKLEPKDTGRSRSAAKTGTPAEVPLAIVPLPAGDVSIYFPAAKETSNLRFHIHAPFASTVARDSVRETPENDQLVADIGDLIVRNLTGFRDRGLIDDGFLAALPNGEDSLKPMYGQVRSVILEAFNEQDLTPVRGGGFGSARELVSSPSEIRRLLREPDLAVLFALTGVEVTAAPRWIADRTGRAGKFLESLEPVDLGWNELTRALSVMQERANPRYERGRLIYGPEPDQRTAFDGWIAAKSDAELLDFYQLLGMGRTNHRFSASVKLGSISMVRIRRRGKAVHLRGGSGDVFLPASRSDTVQSRVPVDLAYFEDDDDERANNLRSFYHAAGVARWNERARTEARLKDYASEVRAIPDTDAEVARHLEDIRGFVRFAAGNKSVARDTFADVPFLLTQEPEGELRWVAPTDTYLDVPFETTGLAALYPWNQEDDGDEAWWSEPEKHAPAGIYLDVEGMEDFLRVVGSANGIPITTARVFQNPELKREWWVNYRHSAYTVTRDWRINGLAEIVETGDPTLLQTLWNTVTDADQTMASAVYQANRSAGRHMFASQLAQQLTTTAWILDRYGELKQPRQVAFEHTPRRLEATGSQLPGSTNLALERRLPNWSNSRPRSPSMRSNLVSRLRTRSCSRRRMPPASRRTTCVRSSPRGAAWRRSQKVVGRPRSALSSGSVRCRIGANAHDRDPRPQRRRRSGPIVGGSEVLPPRALHESGRRHVLPSVSLDPSLQGQRRVVLRGHPIRREPQPNTSPERLGPVPPMRCEVSA